MNVLVTGGYGFIGSFVAEKFYREGHKVFVLDNLSTGNKDNLTFTHSSSTLEVENERCEEIFKANKFDVVIHLAAQVDVRTSIENPVLDTKSNILGLLNMLHLTQKYKVEKFVFASSAAVYGQNKHVPLLEGNESNPISPYGFNKWLGENYCQKWNEMYNLETLCFRFSNVYGPRQNASGDGGVISIFMDNLVNKKPLTIHGDGTQTRDFIYVEDLSEAIYRSVLSDMTGIYNLSSSTEISINELVETLSEITELPAIVSKDCRQGDIHRSCLDNSLLLEHLDWVPKYTLREGLEKTHQWFSTNSKKETSTKTETRLLPQIHNDKKPNKTNPFTPYLENGFLFIITIFLESVSQNSFESIDFMLIYILFTGMWLGKSQSILASVLTIIFYTYTNLVSGRELISLFIDNETLLHFVIYILIGIVSGYVIDKRNAKEQSIKMELDSLQSKHSFLTEIYQETRQVKEDLQNQILNSEDSVGKVYSIVNKLDSLEPEDIFAEAISVLEQTLKTQSVAIYVIGQNRQFLRLVSNSKNSNLSIPSSIKIDQETELASVINKGSVFVNKKLKPELPLVMAPIIRNDHTIGIICVYEMNFEQLTLHYQNLLKVVVNLISASFARAYVHMQATNQERYITNSIILKPHYFHKLIEQKKNLKETLGIEFTLMELEKSIEFTNYQFLLEGSLRETDYIGMDDSGRIYLVLANTCEVAAEVVYNRLTNKGVPLKIHRELSYV